MFEKMTDGDVMIYLRNASLQLAELAGKKGFKVNIYCETDGYFNTGFGDYEISHFPENNETEYYYRPLGQVKDWQENLKPCQIRFGQRPLEVSHEK